MLLFLRKLIFRLRPDLTEKLSYQVPFYKRHKEFSFYGRLRFCGERNKASTAFALVFSKDILLADEIIILPKETENKSTGAIFQL